MKGCVVNKQQPSVAPTHWSGVVLVTALVTAGLGATTVAVVLGRQLKASPTSAAVASEPASPKRPVPEFSLIDQNGKPVTRSDLLGKVWIADFVFTSCTTACPRMANRMKQIQEALVGAPTVRLVSFSIDPTRDTPAVLKAYGESLGASVRRWVFLTGDQSAIHELARKGFSLGVEESSAEDRAKGADAFVHSMRFALVDAAGCIHGYYDSTDDDAVERLIRDTIRLAGSGQIVTRP